MSKRGKFISEAAFSSDPKKGKEEKAIIILPTFYLIQ